jgi:DNA-directed RNA polymerase specialized sigma24 family protein
VSHDEYQAFAGRELGPASYRLVQTDLGKEDLRRRQEKGGEVLDIVLGAVFDALKRGDGEKELSEEFFMFLIPHAEARSHGRVAPDLKRHLESQDLANSVLGNIWSDVDKLEFTTFPQFLAMLVQRLSWKASNRGRDLRRHKRSEDARVDLDVNEMEGSGSKDGPITELVRAEDNELFIKTIMALPVERERKLIMDHLEGRGVAELAVTYGLEVESARKALRRALNHARALLDFAKRARDGESGKARS